MREKDIHKLIEQENPEVKERIWQRITAEFPEYATAEPVAKPQKSVKKWIALAFALLCVITLSVVLPLTLGPQIDGNTPPINADTNPPTPSQDENRYCTATQYEYDSLKKTLKEYFNANNLNLLYVDWYEVGEEIVTKYGYMKNDSSDIVFFEELITNGESGEVVTLYITDNKTRVDKFDTYYKSSDEFLVGNLTVKWQDDMRKNTLAMFEYQNYTYYLNIDIPDGQARLKEIIQDMLK